MASVALSIKIKVHMFESNYFTSTTVSYGYKQNNTYTKSDQCVHAGLRALPKGPWAETHMPWVWSSNSRRQESWGWQPSQLILQMTFRDFLPNLHVPSLTHWRPIDPGATSTVQGVYPHVTASRRRVMTGQSNSASGMEELHRPGELCALITIQGRHLGVPETPQNWAEFRVMCACVFLSVHSFCIIFKEISDPEMVRSPLLWEFNQTSD